MNLAQSKTAPKQAFKGSKDGFRTGLVNHSHEGNFKEDSVAVCFHFSGVKPVGDRIMTSSVTLVAPVGWRPSITYGSTTPSSIHEKFP